MKKIILFVSAAILVFSTNGCSSSDSEPAIGGKINAKINGVATTFDLVTVTVDTYTDNMGVSQTSLFVQAHKTGSEVYIGFIVRKSVTGNEALIDLAYQHSGEEPPLGAYDGTFKVQVNDFEKKRLKGTFSGTVADIASATVTLSGNFNVNY